MAKVMIAGSGAREHSLANAYFQSSDVKEVLITPGNQGMLIEEANFKIDPSTSLTDKDSFLRVAQEYKPDLIDIAQDDALAAGTVDLLKENGFRVFGPTKAASRVEWDKKWSREFMERAGLPVPKNRSFSRTSGKEAMAYAESLLEKCGTIFVKASGLFAGKGVIPATTRDEASDAMLEMGSMGDAGKTFIVEEGMEGEEFSYYAMVDGENYICFKSAQDNKRVWNRDKGPNTGGMGCNAPALVTKGLAAQIEKELIAPQVAQLAKEGIPYTGILYIGGMVLDKAGSLGIVEDNSRWGDPECHVILPGIENDYFELVNKAVDGELSNILLREDNLTRVCVIGASAGYPTSYDKGKKLTIDYDARNFADFLSAGMKMDKGHMYTNGGRVFSFVGKGEDVIVARQNALKAMAYCSIEDNGLHYRTDIAWRDIQRVQAD